MQARLEQEMRQRQELEAERAERQAQAQRLTDITEFLQGLGQRVGFSLPAGLLVPSPPPCPTAADTLVSMNFFTFACALLVWPLHF